MPSIIELDRGELLVAFMGGVTEGKADTGCYTSRLYADENTWAIPKVAVAAKLDVPCWNPVLLKLPEGEVVMFYKRGPRRESWSGLVPFRPEPLLFSPELCTLNLKSSSLHYKSLAANP
mmetsp:Transcript_7551/g.11842  ORF Transcript_7551/g.11842 Transcript_7551/m.11842 type:complete len:119 (-) Transcript_7551:256-612(-)